MTGLAIGLIAIPPYVSRSRLIFGLTYCAIAANMPDLGIAHWGHSNYAVSHSIFVNGAIILALASAIAYVSKISTREISWALLFALAGAWLSHLLLDTFYNHGLGLRMFWPFSKAALALPMPWFHTIDIKQSFTAWHNMSEFLTEGLFFTLLLAPAFFIRRRRCSLHSSPLPASK